MPKIGLRNIKTALAVFLTMQINLILYIISPTFASTWYSPFFASIAAAYSMQRDNSKSFSQARIRSFGSITGGVFGMLLVLFYEAFIQTSIIETYGAIGNMFFLYSLTALFLVILIYMMVRFKFHEFVFVAVLTYLSVTISLRNNLPVVPFALNRILSTIIGVLVTLLINNLNLARFKNTHLLFVSGLDQCLLTPEKKLTSYTSYTLTKLLHDGLNFTISTSRTPASLSRILDGIPLKNELMIMNGAVSYDIQHEKYTDIKYINKPAQAFINAYFASINRNVFTYTIIDQALSIYHTSFGNEAEEKFYLDRKNDYFRNHIKGIIGLKEDAVFYIVIDKLVTVETYAQDLLSQFKDDITCQIYPYSLIDDYYYLKIYAAGISKKTALDEFLNKNQESAVIAFGSKTFDIDIMKNSDLSIVLNSADNEVKAIADIVIPSEQPDELIKIIKKIFYARDYKKTLLKLKNRYQTKI